MRASQNTSRNWAARAALLAYTGSVDEAAEAYGRAIGLESDQVVRRFLQGELAEITLELFDPEVRMTTSFNCPRCGSRIRVSWLAVGEPAHCGKCGEQVPVPNESEPPLSRDKVPLWLTIRSALWARMGLIVAGLLPSAVVCIGLMIRFVDMSLVAPLVANLILGVIVGQSVSRRRFLYGTGVAVAGWILSSFPGAFVFFEIIPLVTGHKPEGSEATGGGMFIGVFLMVGLLASPLAGIASAVGHRREDALP